eukprot:15218505-Alexandrium_andersonii.AAC.1
MADVAAVSLADPYLRSCAVFEAGSCNGGALVWSYKVYTFLMGKLMDDPESLLRALPRHARYSISQ